MGVLNAASKRLMPDRINLGQHANMTMAHPILRWENCAKRPDDENPAGKRTVMGYPLPDWQRPLVWTEAQQVRFLESAWLGLPLGTYTYNQVVFDKHRELDGLLIDGQQRMWSVERYITDCYPVFGYRYSEITDIDRRIFVMSISFPCYIASSTDEQYLKDYYNLMNFGGTAHTEEERA